MQIDVKLKQGVYTIFVDLVTGKAFPIIEGQDPPIESFPQSFTSLEAIKQLYPEAQIRVVGSVDSAPEPVYIEDLQAEFNKLENENQIINNQKISEHEILKSELITLFKIRALEMMRDKRQKNTYKHYINGMSKVILFIFPDLKKTLIDIVTDAPVESDLL